MPDENPPRKWRWYHALLFWVLVNLSQYAGLGGDISSYERLRQAPFAPPAWIFGPAWFCLCILMLWAGLRLLNHPDLRHRPILLGLQGLNWLIYATFVFVNFQLKSPILAFAWTAGMLVLTLASVVLAWPDDRKISFLLLPLLAWLGFASVLGGYQMFYNADPFFGPGFLQK